MAEKSCEGCGAKCCKYIALEIDAPETKEDMENIRWYVLHKNVNVYVDCEGVWHLEFLTPCENLGEDNKCKIYDKRPIICREYDADTCLHHNEYEEEYTFTNIEEVDKYIKEHF